MNDGTPRRKVDTVIHLIAGGTGGTIGAIVTCPLEVIKTRLQSSNSGFNLPSPSSHGPTTTSTGSTPSSIPTGNKISSTMISSNKFIKSHPIHQPQMFNLHNFHTSSSLFTTPSRPSLNHRGAYECFRFIIKTEGIRGLTKGLGPNLVGVAPARAIYFWAYNFSKHNLSCSLSNKHQNSPWVHIFSAASAGFTASTLTNPIWLVKTRLQLDRKTGGRSLSVKRCIRNIYNAHGIAGFWKGVTASYYGIAETMIHFVIYEEIKKRITQEIDKLDTPNKNLYCGLGFMLCAAISKFCATCVAYPHEVARTRLREDGSKYKSFWQTLSVVYAEEGKSGLYRGLTTQLIRQIPNTAIMVGTYELSVRFLTKWLKGENASRQLYTSVEKTSNSSPTVSASAAAAAVSSNNDDIHHITQKTSHSQ